MRSKILWRRCSCRGPQVAAERAPRPAAAFSYIWIETQSAVADGRQPGHCLYRRFHQPENIKYVGIGIARRGQT